MSERVAGHALGDRGALGRVADGTLEDGLMEVVAAVLSGLAMKVTTSRRKDPLPHPFPACMRILSGQRRG